MINFCSVASKIDEQYVVKLFYYYFNSNFTKSAVRTFTPLTSDSYPTGGVKVRFGGKLCMSLISYENVISGIRFIGQIEEDTLLNKSMYSLHRYILMLLFNFIEMS